MYHWVCRFVSHIKQFCSVISIFLLWRIVLWCLFHGSYSTKEKISRGLIFQKNKVNFLKWADYFCIFYWMTWQFKIFFAKHLFVKSPIVIIQTLKMFWFKSVSLLPMDHFCFIPYKNRIFQICWLKKHRACKEEFKFPSLNQTKTTILNWIGHCQIENDWGKRDG